MAFFSMADALSYVDKDIAEWPAEHKMSIADIALQQIRYRQDHNEAHTIEQLHPVALAMMQPFLGCLPDLCLTGSWVGGWWSHPEHGATDRKILRNILRKPPISDLDFWTPETPRDKAMDVVKSIGRKHNIPVSWVEWWGPALDLQSNQWRACNPDNKYRAEWAYLNVSV